MRRLILALAVLVSAKAALAAAPSGWVKAQMKTVVEPASTLVFAVGSEVDPDNGPGQPPTPDKRWLDALAASEQLHAVGLGLLKPENVRAGPVWTETAQAFTTATADAAAAARARNAADLTKAVNALGDTCAACHDRYIAKPAG